MWSMNWIEMTGYGQVEVTYENGNETSVSIKCREFLDWLKKS
jgi:hypothetical protein